MNPPKRAVTLDISLQADSPADMALALEQVAYLVHRGELTRGCSGGVNSGYTYHYEANDRPTHEEYREQLQQWLAAQKESA